MKNITFRTMPEVPHKLFLSAVATVRARDLVVGSKIYAAASFTTNTGIFVREGDAFTVETVGSHNAKLRADQHGSVVWVTEFDEVMTPK
jgi:hypothetical protein